MLKIYGGVKRFSLCRFILFNKVLTMLFRYDIIIYIN